MIKLVYFVNLYIMPGQPVTFSVADITVSCQYNISMIITGYIQYFFNKRSTNYIKELLALTDLKFQEIII